MSGNVKEGATLDTYVQLSVAMTKPGASPDEVLCQRGMSMEQWQKVSAAWIDAMSKDTEFKLTTEYGALYQKYAGPAFQQAQFEQTAAILADRNKPQDVINDDGPASCRGCGADLGTTARFCPTCGAPAGR